MSDETTGGVEEPQDDGGAQASPTEVARRTLYRHPLAAVGGAMILAGVVSFVVLVLIDLTAPENPYRSLVTFVAVPAIITLGAILFLVAVRIQVVQARRRGEQVRFNLRIEPSDPRYMRSLWIFLGLGVLLIVLVGWSGVRAYEATDSVAFCGDTCHEVMAPQAVTYEHSPHARVSCAECHIGPGGSFWVRSKIDGIRQVWKTLTNSYDRPIATPIENLRPAQETCEECHWPQQFFGDKLLTTTYYTTDEANSPWTISMAVKVGGGNPRSGELEGIHWHMLTANVVEYIATDEQRQEIPWVRVTDEEGNVIALYTDVTEEAVDPGDPDLEIRRFDCMDCHNRPSHNFEPPATAMNLEIARGAISRDLPFIRLVGLELLNAEYETTEEANAAIPAGLRDYYRLDHPDQYDALAAEIDQAAEALLRIYNGNFFPEMETDYRVRVNNLSHFVNDGCFRCHTADLQTAEGVSLATSCDTCHVILAQGPSDNLDELEQSITGVEFVHPVDIGGVWETIRCTQCHNRASGY
jgi:hypothetical protein